MAEPISIQQLKDASLDVKSLEEAVNGDENVVVTTRLGETYPTLSNALSQIDGKLDSADAQIKQGITNLFQNGSLPATPFATKALMTASALADGKYAMVTDDTVNNGLYLKTNGAWVKSAYDPLTLAKVDATTKADAARVQAVADSKAYTQSEVSRLIETQPKWSVAETEIVTNFAVTGTMPEDFTRPNAAYDHIIVDLKGADKFRLSGSLPAFAQQKMSFADVNKVRIAVGSHLNGTYDVPEGARYVYKNVRIPAGTDSNVLFEIFEGGGNKITALEESVTVLRNDVDALQDVTPNPVSPSTASDELLRMETQMYKAFERGDMLKISSFLGANGHEKIENAIAFIKRRGWGILDMESGTWVRNSAILLPDNCWIYLNTSTIKLANGVFDNVMRNDGIVVDPNNPYGVALALNPSSNIRIFGAGINQCFIACADIPKTAPHPINGGAAVPWIGDFYGWRAVAVLLANSKNHKIDNVGFKNTTSWAISQEHGCTGMILHDLDFKTAVKNGDGIDFRMGCSGGEVYNITGVTSDDLVALTAIKNWQTSWPVGNYIYPTQVGGYADRGFGVDITDIDIYNIEGSGDHNGVRLLCSGGSKLKNITVNGVSDTTTAGYTQGAIVLVSSGYGTPAVMGDMIDISINGIVSNNSGTPLKLAGKIKDSQFHDILQKRTWGTWINDTSEKINVTITNGRGGGA